MIKWIVGVLVAIAVVVMISPFTIINPSTRGLVIRLGAVDRVLPEGIHWVTPFVESVKTFDVSVQKASVESGAASKDLQTVDVKLAVNYALDPAKVGELWQAFQGQQEERLIDPAIQEATKAATANYTAEELITKREEVRSQILSNLKERLGTYNILVSNVSITNFDFSKTFNEAIEAKVTAEQNALAAKNKLEQVKFEADQKIATAEAEAKSIRLKSDAANNEKYVALQQLEVQKAMAEKWNGVLPVNVYGSAPIPFLPLSK